MNKNYVYSLLIALCFSLSAHAAPGDTTWVGATDAQLSWYGSYDSVIAFPAQGKTYRSIYMIFTLGKYVCPGSPTYCGDWDYTIQNYLILPGGQSYELGRLISPYANAGAPRTPWSWTQHYVYDVTDYAMLLHDTAKMRIFYSGYSGGFTGNIRFMFIEGTPDREVTGIEKLWGGSYGYGDTSHHGANFINVHFPTRSRVAPQNTVSAQLKFTVTGHGSDANYCCEFMPHDYTVYFNSSPLATQTIWRSDCGSNELYPQSGTWLYERANWCPGSMVNSYYHNLPGITSGAGFDIGLQFEPYVGGGSYTTEATLFYYGALKKTLDASIEDVIAPNKDENHFRENPICGSPVIRIKNRGASKITSAVISYGLVGGAMHTQNWSGGLNTFDEAVVTLGQLPELNNIAGDTATHTFIAKILSVNGTADADSTNNIARSIFFSAPRWPSQLKVLFKANSEAIASSATTCETSWFIFDRDNNVVAKRDMAHINTLYTDTVNLKTGFYKLVIYDSSCDGLQWWAMAGQPGYAAGFLTVRQMNNTTIPMHGYVNSGTYGNDFGCGFTQYFYTVDSVHLGINTLTQGDMAINAFPNPAQNTVVVEITGVQDVKGHIQVIDALGRVVSEVQCSTASNRLDVAALSNGVYTILFTDDTPGRKLVTRLLIAK